MRELLNTHRVVDLALVLVGVEVAVLLAIRQWLGRGLRPLDLFGQILAGVFLLLALRSALRDDDIRYTLSFLTASFPAHLFDLARRARRSPRASASSASE